MKTKPTKEKLKTSLVTCFFMILFNFLFSVAAFILISYWAIPNVCTVIPSLRAYFESLNDQALSVAYDIIYLAGACVAIFPAAALAYRISKKRKKEFLTHSKGRISYVDGIKYHISEYGACDLICSLTITVLLALLYMIAGDVFIVRGFPTAYCMFNSVGVILGSVFTMILTILSMCLGIFLSQNKWRAEYFVN